MVMAEAEHYKKKQQREKVSLFLKFLREKGNLSFTEGKTLLNVSSTTMSSYIRQLLCDQKIEQYSIIEEKKPKKQRYRLSKENLAKVQADIGKYEAIQFIEELQSPIYYHTKSKDGRTAVAAFADGNTQKQRDIFQTILGAGCEYAVRLYQKINVSPVRTAFVIMMEPRSLTKKEGVKP